MPTKTALAAPQATVTSSTPPQGTSDPKAQYTQVSLEIYTPSGAGEPAPGTIAELINLNDVNATQISLEPGPVGAVGAECRAYADSDAATRIASPFNVTNPLLLGAGSQVAAVLCYY